MATTIKRLGDYITDVDERAGKNSSYSLNDIRGISSITKLFQKTKANLVDVSPSGYKVVKPLQFAFNPNTARMGDKIPIALNLEGQNILVSSIYPVFEIKNIENLDPQYLWLWFKRSEFDRYARFKSHGSAREIFSWEEMQEIRIPIPDIKTQKRIINQYNHIQEDAKNTSKVIRKLDLFGKYLFKTLILESNCTDAFLTDIASFKNGAAMQKYECEQGVSGSLPVLKIRELNLGYCDEKSNTAVGFPSNLMIKNGDLIFSWSGTLAIDLWAGGNAALNQHLFLVSSNKYPKWLYYYWTREHLDNFIRIADGKKTSMGHIQKGDLQKAKVSIPNAETISKYNNMFESILDLIVVEKEKLIALQRLNNNLLRCQN